MTVKRVLLAYSGGLDTSVAVRWIADQYKCEVVCFCADVGQDEDLEAARQKALAVGAKKAVVRDLRLEFVRDYVWPVRSMKGSTCSARRSRGRASVAA